MPPRRVIALAVGLVVRHRVERVRDREDARDERNLGAAKAARIAEAVPALVMGRDHVARRLSERRHRRDDALAEPRVLVDLVDLGRRERPLLRQRRVRDADHADVVQPEPVGELRVQDQLGRARLGQRERELCDARRVGRRLAEAPAPVVVELERTRERLHGCGCRFEPWFGRRHQSSGTSRACPLDRRACGGAAE